MKRREVKIHHENSVLSSFTTYMADQGHKIEICDQPDPPDAEILLDGKKTWIEITDAFFSMEFARSLSSYVPDDVQHIPSGGKLELEPDAGFRVTVANVVEKKYKKQSIGKIFKNMGPGILLVGLYSPFLDSDNLHQIQKDILGLGKLHDGRFSKIYVYEYNHEFHVVI
jgi:hypothetical protein